jgi:hypothetical protein
VPAICSLIPAPGCIWHLPILPKAWELTWPFCRCRMAHWRAPGDQARWEDYRDRVERAAQQAAGA